MTTTHVAATTDNVLQSNQSKAISSAEVYYFWLNAETNTYGVTVADSESDNFEVIDEFTIDDLSSITAPIAEGGNGEGAAWGDALTSSDGSRIFVNARNADKVVVIDTETRSVETILDVGDRPVHSFIYEDELWVHVDGDGGFSVIDQETLEVSEVIEANTVGTGHGKLLLAETLGPNTYVTNTAEPAVFPINLETREVGEPIEIGGGDPELGTHDKGYDPTTGYAFFQLTDGAGFTFIDTATNEVVFDQVPILGRITHTPDDDFVLVLNAGAEENDIGIWNTQLEGHTQPDFDSMLTIGGGVSVNGTGFYQDGDSWEAWIPQTVGDNVAVLNLTTNDVDYIDLGNLTVPEGARHFSRRGEIDDDFFFSYSDEGALRVDLDSYAVSEAIPLGGAISRMTVVDTSTDSDFELEGTNAADSMVGTDVDEQMQGHGGDDVMAGGHGHDVMLGGAGDDVLRGDLNDRAPQDGEAGGNDIIFGGEGSDRIGGKSGNDILSGDAGDDFIWGDDGDDIIMGVTGNDVLVGDNFSGGSGSDLFVFGSGDGTDTILDFEVGTDRIGLVEGELTFDVLTFTQTGDNTVIGFASSGETLAILNNVQASSLGENSFESVTDISTVQDAQAFV